ncbi:MAG: hypothetical protein DWQ05_19255 [Calditrichaeota bacterium]|nr:MAG: hypothetical protein DWQ05_19255 [Calditrichota bacterium]
MHSANPNMKNTDTKLAGVLDQMLQLLQILDEELCVEFKSLSASELSSLKSSQHRQVILQTKIEKLVTELKINGAFDDGLVPKFFKAEKISAFKLFRQGIKKQVNKNYKLTMLKKVRLKDEMGPPNRLSPVNRKNFPKFSHLSPPEIVDIRR